LSRGGFGACVWLSFVLFPVQFVINALDSRSQLPHRIHHCGVVTFGILTALVFIPDAINRLFQVGDVFLQTTYPDGAEGAASASAI
jgi:hypothetical protein